MPALAPHIQLLLVHPEIARAATADTSRGMADGCLVPVEIAARELRQAVLPAQLVSSRA